MEMDLVEFEIELATRREKSAIEIVYLERVLRGTRRLLDIGCGKAVTSIWLAKRMGLEMLYLMDGAMADRRNGYHNDTEGGWCDLGKAIRLAEVNGVEITTLAPTTDADFRPDFDTDVTCDSIISLLSWGHHYPVSVYLPLAKRALSLGGRVVLDLRIGTPGRVEMKKNGFKEIELVFENKKRQRICFEKVS